MAPRFNIQVLKELVDIMPSLFNHDSLEKRSFLTQYFGSFDYTTGTYTSGKAVAMDFLRQFIFSRDPGPAVKRTPEELFCFHIPHQFAIAREHLPEEMQNEEESFEIEVNEHRERALLHFFTGLASVSMLQDVNDVLTVNKLFHHDLGEAKTIAMLVIMLSDRSFEGSLKESGNRSRFLNLIYFYLLGFVREVLGGRVYDVTECAKALYLFLTTFSTLPTKHPFLNKQSLENPKEKFSRKNADSNEADGKGLYEAPEDVIKKMTKRPLLAFMRQSKPTKAGQTKILRKTIKQLEKVEKESERARQNDRPIPEPKLQLDNVVSNWNTINPIRAEKNSSFLRGSFPNVNSIPQLHVSMVSKMKTLCVGGEPDVATVSLESTIFTFLEAARLRPPIPSESNAASAAMQYEKDVIRKREFQAEKEEARRKQAEEQNTLEELQAKD
eukprot:snap_masked-scaffold_90-processed-gene-0.31-mRNA-1 protein AED:1.00 eAED:1.00 QI:0/-1/0/0/-1/1/1/0/440